MASDQPISDSHQISQREKQIRMFKAVRGLSDRLARSASLQSFEVACRAGDLEYARNVISSHPPASEFLADGVLLASIHGQAAILRMLLEQDADFARRPPLSAILEAPASAQLDLFKAFADFGWHPNTPTENSLVLSHRLVVTNTPLLEWLLENGANPNLGHLRGSGMLIANSGDALEIAAKHCPLSTVALLLAHGAQAENSMALNRAAGAYPPGGNFYYSRARPTPEFDRDRIPVMELLLQHGADINGDERQGRRDRTPGLPVTYAVMARAVERVKWLLENGADPTIRGYPSSAAELGLSDLVDEDMHKVMRDGIAAERWKSGPEPKFPR
ncbi:MAG: hypothetical protein Q9165_003736 [Trypethelium subeluteriae]